MYNIDTMTLGDYIRLNFDVFCDATKERMATIDMMMNDINGDFILAKKFMKDFGITSFFDVMSFVFDERNYKTLCKYGKSFDLVKEEVFGAK